MKHVPAPRSYGCSMGDGNPYDFVVVTVVDSTTLFLCAPCFVRTAMEMVQALTEPDSPEVKTALSRVGDTVTVPFDNGQVRGRGHNAPAETEDPDLFEAFETVITVDELGDDFK